MDYQRPGLLKSLKTVLLVIILIKVMLGVGLYVWFYLDQQTALRCYRIFETDFKEDDVQSSVLWNIVFDLIIIGLELFAISFEIFLLALLLAV